MPFNDNLSPNSEHYQCTKAVFFQNYFIFIIWNHPPSWEMSIIAQTSNKWFDIYQSTFVLQWKLLLHLYIFYNKRYWGDLNIWNTYIQYMFKTLYMIHTKSIWKKFQLRMVLDYIQHTRILKMLHFTIFIWYILHIMNTIFLLVQYTPKRLKCICLLNNYPNNFAFC